MLPLDMLFGELFFYDPLYKDEISQQLKMLLLLLIVKKRKFSIFNFGVLMFNASMGGLFFFQHYPSCCFFSYRISCTRTHIINFPFLGVKDQLYHSSDAVTLLAIYVTWSYSAYP